jgi:hypothetical protein
MDNFFKWLNFGVFITILGNIMYLALFDKQAFADPGWISFILFITAIALFDNRIVNDRLSSKIKDLEQLVDSEIHKNS